MYFVVVVVVVVIFILCVRYSSPEGFSISSERIRENEEWDIKVRMCNFSSSEMMITCRTVCSQV